jgi:hypothetical protein
MALVKVQVQSITLIFGQGLQKSLNGRISDQFGQNSGLFPPRTQIGEAFGFLQIGGEYRSVASSSSGGGQSRASR